jgi:hypothetical protein
MRASLAASGALSGFSSAAAGSRLRAVFRRDAVHAGEAEACEVGDPCRVARVVELVDRQGDRLGAAVERAREVLLDRNEPRRPVDQEQDRVGLRHRGAGLLLDGGGEPLAGIGIEPRRIHEQDPPPVRQLDLAGDGVARDPRLVLDERAPEARIAVEEGRFADVGATDDRHDRERLGRLHGEFRGPRTTADPRVPPGPAPGHRAQRRTGLLDKRGRRLLGSR